MPYSTRKRLLLKMVELDNEKRYTAAAQAQANIHAARITVLEADNAELRQRLRDGSAVAVRVNELEHEVRQLTAQLATLASLDEAAKVDVDKKDSKQDAKKPKKVKAKASTTAAKAS